MIYLKKIKYFVLLLMINQVVKMNCFAEMWSFDSLDNSIAKTKTVISKMDVEISTPHIEGWSDDRQLTTVESQAPMIVNDENGLHIVWRGHDSTNSRGFDLYYTKSIDNGKIWSNDKRLTFALGDVGYYGRGFISFNNSLYIVWTDTRTGNEEIYFKKSEDGGENWSIDKRLTYTNSRTMYPSICTSSTTLFIVFVDSPIGSYSLYMTTSTDKGDSWCQPYTLTTATVYGTSSFWVPTTDILYLNNKLHIFWTDNREGKSQIYYKKSEDGGHIWTNDTNLSNSPDDSVWSKVISGKNNELHLFYESNEDYPGYPFEIYYRKSTDGGLTWSNKERITDLDNYRSAIGGGVDDDSGLHFFWGDYSYPNGLSEIHYKRSLDNGNTWSNEQRLNYLTASESPSVVSVNGVLHLVWSDMDYRGEDHIFYKFFDPTPPTGKPTTPAVVYKYDGGRSAKWEWTQGDVNDPESNFVWYRFQFWEEPGTLIDDIPGEGGNGLTLSDGDVGATYRIRVRARTETYRFTEWSNWSEFITVNSPLVKAKVYPNPIKNNSNQNAITFENLSNDEATIKIFHISGELLTTLSKDNSTDKYIWNLTNEKGERLSSGIYIYLVKNAYAIKKGKVAIIN